MAEDHVTDVKGDGKWSVDCEAKDGFEEVVKSVVPPGKSLAGVDEEAVGIVDGAPKN